MDQRPSFFYRLFPHSRIQNSCELISRIRVTIVAASNNLCFQTKDDEQESEELFSGDKQGP